MRSNTKSFTALLAVTILLSGVGLVLTEHVGEAYADPYLKEHVLESDVHHVGSTYTRTFELYGPGQGVNVESVTVDGKKYTWQDRPDIWNYNNSGPVVTLTLPILENKMGAVKIEVDSQAHVFRNMFEWTTYVARTTYEVNGSVGTAFPEQFNIPAFAGFELEYGSVPGLSFAPQNGPGFPYMKPTGTYTKVGTYEILTNWGSLVKFNISPPLLEIPYVEASDAIAESNWVYSPTTLTGVTLVIDGPGWVSVSGNTIYGIPPAPGDYEITVTISKAGYADVTKMFTLTAVSKLVITNSPLTGVIFAV